MRGKNKQRNQRDASAYSWLGENNNACRTCPAGALPLTIPGKGADRGVDGLLYFYETDSVSARNPGSTRGSRVVSGGPPESSTTDKETVARGRTTEHAGRVRCPEKNYAANSSSWRGIPRSSKRRMRVSSIRLFGQDAPAVMPTTAAPGGNQKWEMTSRFSCKL